MLWYNDVNEVYRVKSVAKIYYINSDNVFHWKIYVTTAKKNIFLCPRFLIGVRQNVKCNTSFLTHFPIYLVLNLAETFEKKYSLRELRGWMY